MEMLAIDLATGNRTLISGSQPRFRAGIPERPEASQFSATIGRW
jgi:hypothetical protein